MDLNTILNLAQNKGYKVSYKEKLNVFTCNIYYKDEYHVISRIVTPEPSLYDDYRLSYVTRIILAKQEIKDKLIEVLNLNTENECIQIIS